jgi:hypothetical protein
MFTSEHIGRRVIYTDRNDKEHLGVIRDVVAITANTCQVDVERDGCTRPRYYVPGDTVRFASEDGTATPPV